MSTEVSTTSVQLRDHPLMSYQGSPNWPPAWVAIDAAKEKYLTGEIGILKKVTCWTTLANRCFLTIEYNQSMYLGCVLFDDPAFYAHMCNLLKNYCGCSIKQIGDLDLAYTL